jgi:hypothetical protein
VKDEDPIRGERLCAVAAGLYLDYSKNHVSDEPLDLLLPLAEQSDLQQRRDMMFAGERINVCENRSVWLMLPAARRPTGRPHPGLSGKGADDPHLPGPGPSPPDLLAGNRRGQVQGYGAAHSRRDAGERLSGITIVSNDAGIMRWERI